MNGSFVQLADGPNWIPIAAAIAGATMAALLAVITAVFQDWRTRRNEAVRQRQAIDDASRYMDLIQHTLDASRRVPESPESATAEKWATSALDQAFAHMPDPIALPETPRPQRVYRILRRGLLITSPTSIGMFAAQLTYWLTIGFTSYIIVVGLTMGGTWQNDLTAIGLIIIIFAPIAAFMHYLAFRKSNFSRK